MTTPGEAEGVTADLVGPGCAEYAQQVPSGPGSIEPVDGAFEALDPATLETLKTDSAMLTAISTCHALPGRIAPDDDGALFLSAGRPVIAFTHEFRGGVESLRDRPGVVRHPLGDVPGRGAAEGAGPVRCPVASA